MPLVYSASIQLSREVIVQYIVYICLRKEVFIVKHCLDELIVCCETKKSKMMFHGKQKHCLGVFVIIKLNF